MSTPCLGADLVFFKASARSGLGLRIRPGTNPDASTRNRGNPIPHRYFDALSSVNKRGAPRVVTSVRACRPCRTVMMYPPGCPATHAPSMTRASMSSRSAGSLIMFCTGTSSWVCRITLSKAPITLYRAQFCGLGGGLSNAVSHKVTWMEAP